MAIKVNLLPPEYSVSGPLTKALKMLKMLNVILLAIFVIASTAIGGFLIFSVIQLRSSTAEEETLKSQLAAQQESEQQLVLLKDRVAKVNILNSTPGAHEVLDKVDPIIAGITGDGLVTELDMDSKKTDLSVLFRTNSQLTAFLTSLKSTDKFKSVVLSSFGYNPSSGYLASFHLN